MASEKKKNKLKNSYQYKTALKDKLVGIKGMSFFTSSERLRLKQEARDDYYIYGIKEIN